MARQKTRIHKDGVIYHGDKSFFIKLDKGFIGLSRPVMDGTLKHDEQGRNISTLSYCLTSRSATKELQVEPFANLKNQEKGTKNFQFFLCTNGKRRKR